MIRTQVYLHDQQYHLAKLLAAQENTPFAEFIRHGVELAIEERRQQQSKETKKRHKAFEKMIGSIRTGYNANAARDHNDIYDGKLSQELGE